MPLKFDSKQFAFLSKNYVARVATCGRSARPHVSPVYFANDDVSIFFATEKDTQKFRDFSENARGSIVVDDFDADWLHNRKGTATTEHAVIVSGHASIFESGSEYSSMRSKLFEKYPDYKEENWEKSASPIIKVAAARIVSWGI
ncbi:MAG: pyridoxamine 5'-phosphate oxidase family protein [Nitrososphaerales archaeon]